MQGPTDIAWASHRFAITLAIHLFFGIMVSTRVWYLPEDWVFMAFASLPMAQCSLVMLWAATSRTPDYLRFIAATAAVFACWYELSTLITWASTGTTAMLWIVLLLYQSLFVLIATITAGFVRLRPVKVDGERPRFAFRIRTLQCWTVVVAATLTFLNFGRTNWAWDMGWMRSGVHVTVLAFSVLNSVIAIVWSLVWQASRIGNGLRRGVVAIVLLPLLCWLTSLAVIRWGVPLANDSLFQFQVAAAMQSVILSLTFWAVGTTSLRPTLSG